MSMKTNNNPYGKSRDPAKFPLIYIQHKTCLDPVEKNMMPRLMQTHHNFKTI